MHGVKLAQITVRATRKEIALLRKAATRNGSGTPAKFLAALFERTFLTHRYREPRTVRRPKL
jgi:hypothetical protein